ncbi:MAG: hypothetical protein MUO52_12310, partial [Desulfobacterales bacterium]|nr:hypothetical protein [Desulfobacterales bacterium]
ELQEPDNYWYYEARIMDKRLELEYMLAQIPDDQTEPAVTLFHVLENLCLFWMAAEQSEGLPGIQGSMRICC